MKKMVIIGGGPGGYVAAIRAAQLGAEVHLIEKEYIGGTCLNVGCIPTKALLHAAELYQESRCGSAWGIEADPAVDWSKVMLKKQDVVSRLVRGVEGLLKANGVTVHTGTASFTGPHTVKVGDETLSADAVIIATGTAPAKLSFPGADLPGVIDSTGALSLPRIPSSLAIIGGGVIGVEFAALYRAFGAEVTVIEMLPEILPTVDAEIAGQVRNHLAKIGISFVMGGKVERIVNTEAGMSVQVTGSQGIKEIPAETVLVAVGRRPATDALQLESAGVRCERGKILVNEWFETNVPGVYAIGDCNGQIMLAHAASAQGIAAVEHALGHKPAYFANTIPSCIYVNPEVAGVGLSEEQVKAKEIPYKVGRFPLAGNGKSVIASGGTGLIKIISGAKYGEILGVHVFGPRATELIGEAALAIRLEATVEELISTVHAHPTVSEAMAEAALATAEMAIHWPPASKRQ